MPRRIDEGDGPAVLLDPVGADVLGDAALLVGGDVDADDRSKSEVLPWSTWPRKVTIGGRGCSRPGRRLLLQRRQQLVLQRNLAAEIDLDAELHGQQLGRLASRLAAMLLMVPIAISLPRMVWAGTPMASEKLRTVQGSSTTTCPCAARRCSRRCGGCAAAPAGEVAADFLFFAAGRLRTPATLFRLSCRCSRPPRVAAPPLFFPLRRGGGGRGAAARGRQAGLRAGRRASPAPGCLRARRASSAGLVLGLLLLVLAEVLGKRLAAGPAGADGVRRELDVGLLRGRLLGFRLGRRLDRRGARGQLHRRRLPFLFLRAWRPAASSAGFFLPRRLSPPSTDSTGTLPATGPPGAM